MAEIARLTISRFSCDIARSVSRFSFCFPCDGAASRASVRAAALRENGNGAYDRSPRCSRSMRSRIAWFKYRPSR